MVNFFFCCHHLDLLEVCYLVSYGNFAFGVELDYRCWRKCFISPPSPIELNTKNKLIAPPQFRFWFCCYHHPIFWKFVTLYVMGKNSYFFCTVRGVRLRKEEKKEKKEKLDTLIKDSLFWHNFRQRIREVQFRFWCWPRLSMLKKVFHFSDIATRVQNQK